VSETPDELHARAAAALRVPPVAEWDSWPFEGELRVRALRAPEPEPPRPGDPGTECSTCAKPDSAYLWTDERWRLKSTNAPTGLPVIVLLEPREHYDSPADLPDDLAREMGVMLGRVERAALSVPGIARVHIGRWGEGTAHLHWWFIGRPTGLRQLASSFAEVWDEVLPPTPEAIWKDNLAHVVRALTGEIRE
jgi:diadenosine tetraphosphate (Ap4A) HIT family hydrolase